MSAFFVGFFSSLSLIFAIGAQNAFVLRQGIKREHIGAIVLFCALSDAILIFLGVTLAAAIERQFSNIGNIFIIIGILFLIGYGLSRLWAAAKGNYSFETRQTQTQSVWQSIAICAAFTWLNPHVYLDTVALIGSLSLPFEGTAKTLFTTGAVLASFTFFGALGYGASYLAPLFSSSRAWRLLDIGISLLMFVIAWGLWQHA